MISMGEIFHIEQHYVAQQTKADDQHHHIQPKIGVLLHLCFSRPPYPVANRVTTSEIKIQ